MHEGERAVKRVEGKIALIFGAGSVGEGWGNGKAAAVAYAREGAKVACIDIDPVAAEATAAVIRAEGGEALAATCVLRHTLTLLANYQKDHTNLELGLPAAGTLSMRTAASCWPAS